MANNDFLIPEGMFFKTIFYIWYMLKSPSLYQPSMNVIRYQCFIRYLKIGAFLHVMGLLGIALFFYNIAT